MLAWNVVHVLLWSLNDDEGHVITRCVAVIRRISLFLISFSQLEKDANDARMQCRFVVENKVVPDKNLDIDTLVYVCIVRFTLCTLHFAFVQCQTSLYFLRQPRAYCPPFHWRGITSKASRLTLEFASATGEMHLQLFIIYFPRV